MRPADKLIDMLCQMLDEFSEKGQLSLSDLDPVFKAAVAKEKLLRCDEIESNMGYSQDGVWRAEGMYSRGNSYNNYPMRMNSYGRSRGYSLADGTSMMMQAIQDKLNDPMTPEADRTVLRRTMEVFNR